MPIKRLAIGLTGQFGAGCTTLADYLCAEHNFVRYSLSDIIRENLPKSFKNKDKKQQRKLMQDKGNKLREHDPIFLAKELNKKIKPDKNNKKIIIDSIRNPAEIEYFRTEYPYFFLIAVDTITDNRWDRVKNDYGSDYSQFTIDDMRDKGEDEPPFGQQTSKCVLDSDIIINNDIEKTRKSEWDQYFLGIKRYLNLIQFPGKYRPTDKELYMHQAYAISLKSSCSKRQVGAVIVNECGTGNGTESYIISSGCNNVPIGEEDCCELANQPSFCSKDDEISKALKGVNFCPSCGRKIKDNDPKEAIKCKYCHKIIFKDFVPGKSLDICRAVHAEEAAIVQAARLGSSSLEETTIYTTTFPCLFCAKSIINAKIKKVIYREPYPMKKAVDMLIKCEVTPEKYEGVNAWAFHKLYKKIQ